MREEIFPGTEDDQNAHNVLTHLLDKHPSILRYSDVVRELGDPKIFSHSDGIERAVAQLEKAELVFRVENLVLLTPVALRAYELMRAYD